MLVDVLALTTVSCGTRAIAGLLLESCTTAPCFIAPENRTVPVAFCPATIEVGTKETDESDGPAGVAGFTERLCVREMLSGVAPMICTMVGGAAALEVIVKVPVVWPAGMVIDVGTCATDGSPEKRRTTVGCGVREAQVHRAGRRLPTAHGVRVDRQRPMLPAAIALPGEQRQAPRIRQPTTRAARYT